MDKTHVKTAAIIALIATVFGSLIASSLVTAQTATPRGAASAVFSKVHGDDPVILSTHWEPIMSIDLPFIGQSLYYKVECDGLLWMKNAICGFKIGVDGHIDNSTYRYYGDDALDDFYSDASIERVYYLGPGAHSFYFKGILQPGEFPEEADAACNYMTITVTVFTHGSLEEPVAEYEIDLDLAKLHEP